MKMQRGFTLIELLIVIAIIGIIAAIAIPSLLHARIAANESAAIGDTRTIISAEATYQSANSGFYGAVSCLSIPSAAECITGYAGPTFVDPILGGLGVKEGYNRSANYSSPAQPTGADTAQDYELYCYFASPAVANKTGVRSFGGDSSGVLGSTNSAQTCCTSGVLNTTVCPALR